MSMIPFAACARACVRKRKWARMLYTQLKEKNYYMIKAIIHDSFVLFHFSFTIIPGLDSFTWFHPSNFCTASRQDTHPASDLRSITRQTVAHAHIHIFGKFIVCMYVGIREETEENQTMREYTYRGLLTLCVCPPVRALDWSFMSCRMRKAQRSPGEASRQTLITSPLRSTVTDLCSGSYS